MDSECQVHSESVVELGHEIERDNADHVAHPFDGDRSDPLGLRLGVAVKSRPDPRGTLRSLLRA